MTNIVDFKKKEDGSQGEWLPLHTQNELEESVERLFKQIYAVTGIPGELLAQDHVETED